MQIRCSQTALSTALADAARIAAFNPAGLRSRSIHVQANDETLVITSAQHTGSAKHLSVTIPASVQAEGQATVPVETLAELIASHPKEAIIELSVPEDAKQLTVTCGKSTARINVFTSPCPEAPALEDPAELLLPAEPLRNCLGSVLNSASNNPEHPVLTGVNLVIDGPLMQAAATDGFRMSLCRQQLAQATGPDLEINIPSDTARELLRYLGRASGALTVTCSPASGTISFQASEEASNAYTLHSQLLPGKFPSLAGHIPQQSATKAILAPASAQAATRIASQFAEDNGGALIVYLHRAEDSDGRTQPKLTIAARSSGHGDTGHDLDIADMDGPPAKTALNPRYLLNALQPLRATKKASIELADPRAPVVLRNGGDGGTFHQTTVIMPMYIDWDSVEEPAPPHAQEAAPAL